MNINEIFYSIQGEGPLAGTPTLFIRFSGCNLRCSFCDSTYAIGLQGNVEMTTKHLFRYLENEKFLGMIPNVHLVFTGGEPMLQQKAIVSFLDVLYNKEGIIPLSTSMETNGTIPIIRNKGIEIDDMVTLAIVSPKLFNSGVPEEKRLDLDVLSGYKNTSGWNCVWKFVVRNKSDVTEAMFDIIDPLSIQSEDVWLMPEGATVREYRKNATVVAELCKEYNFNYSPRLHLDLWKGERGT